MVGASGAGMEHLPVGSHWRWAIGPEIPFPLRRRPGSLPLWCGGADEMGEGRRAVHRAVERGRMVLQHDHHEEGGKSEHGDDDHPAAGGHPAPFSFRSFSGNALGFVALLLRALGSQGPFMLPAH